MLDIKFIEENVTLVKDSLKKRGSTVDIEYILSVNAKRVSLIQKIEALRGERNVLSKVTSVEVKNRLRGKEIKEELKLIEPELVAFTNELTLALAQVPNIVMPQVPAGTGEKDNVVVEQFGKPTKFSFPVKDHLELGKLHDWIDFERGSKVAGSQFYYLKNDLMILEQALIRYALDFLVSKGFTPISTPDLARSRYYLGTGYQPQGPEAQTYTIEGEDLGLIATSEVTLAGYHADEILESKKLPLKYVGLSHCFRREAGAYGRYSKGLYRVHQFTKVEMFVYAKPDQSEKLHLELLDLEKELYKSLEIPFRVLEMCAGDLGGQAARKFDLEAWMPGRLPAGGWGEVTSTSNTTDYQARNLQIKFRNDEGKLEYVHTLNGTAVTSSRLPIAIIENFQQKDGTVKLPKILAKYVGKPVLGKKI
jgi:seryl-tRNA synthetase